MVDFVVLVISAGLFVRIDRRMHRSLRTLPTKNSENVDVFLALIAAGCLVAAVYSSIRIAGKVIVVYDRVVEQVSPHYKQAEKTFKEIF